MLSRIFDEMDYEFQKTLKPTTGSVPAEPSASISVTENEQDTNEVGRDKAIEKVTERSSCSEQAEKNSSGGIFSCFRGNKVEDANKDDENVTANQGRNTTYISISKVN